MGLKLNSTDVLEKMPHSLQKNEHNHSITAHKLQRTRVFPAEERSRGTSAGGHHFNFRGDGEARAGGGGGGGGGGGALASDVANKGECVGDKGTELALLAAVACGLVVVKHGEGVATFGTLGGGGGGREGEGGRQNGARTLFSTDSTHSTLWLYNTHT